MTIRELAERIIELTGSRSQVVEKPLPAGDPTQRCPDIARAKEHLDWQPYVPLEAGLRKTIAHFRDQMRRRHGESPQALAA